MTLFKSPLPYTLAALAAAALLSACNRPADAPTAGQQVDTTIAKAEQKMDEVKADAKAAGQDAQGAMAKAADAVADKTKDAGITVAVNAALAKDPSLSALKIDVDTVGARVALHGTAPDAVSRERATTLAAGVDGVASVDNQLSVKP